MTRPICSVVTALAAALVLAGCSAGNADAPPSGSAATLATSEPTPPAAAAAPSAATDAIAPASVLTPTVAVQVGGDAQLDPCMFARIGAGGPHPVLAGPDENQAQLTTLASGQPVWICDPGDGSWYAGIVWSEHEEMDCQVSSPIAVRAPYSGTCHTGWVSMGALEELAG